MPGWFSPKRPSPSTGGLKSTNAANVAVGEKLLYTVLLTAAYLGCLVIQGHYAGGGGVRVWNNHRRQMDPKTDVATDVGMYCKISDRKSDIMRHGSAAQLNEGCFRAR